MGKHYADRREPGDYDRNRQIIRQWQLLRTLQTSRRAVPALARELGVNARTIRRDLYALEAAGFPLVADDEHRWYLLAWRRESEVA